MTKRINSVGNTAQINKSLLEEVYGTKKKIKQPNNEIVASCIVFDGTADDES